MPTRTMHQNAPTQAFMLIGQTQRAPRKLFLQKTFNRRSGVTCIQQLNSCILLKHVKGSEGRQQELLLTGVPSASSALFLRFLPRPYAQTQVHNMQIHAKTLDTYGITKNYLLSCLRTGNGKICDITCHQILTYIVASSWAAPFTTALDPLPTLLMCSEVQTYCKKSPSGSRPCAKRGILSYKDSSLHSKLSRTCARLGSHGPKHQESPIEGASTMPRGSAVRGD